MRIDLPGCNFKYCKYCFDGNCTSKDKYDNCEFIDAIKKKEMFFLLLEEMNSPVKTLQELAIQYCCLTECKNCPVCIHKFEKRTEYEKCMLHTPCVDNLYKWIISEVENIKCD